MSISRVLTYDFETLPNPPFTIYFFNKAGEVYPKQAYTVTRKIINEEKEKVELFVMELGQFVEYHHLQIGKIHHYFNVN